MDAANTPYKPIGIPRSNIADRIIRVTENPDFKLFDTVAHLTADSACTSILNNALYGRKTLQQLHQPFRPAALWEFDAQNGDVNVICCGPYRIDSECIKPETTRFVFEVKKLSVRNSFFKQLDMGFNDKIQHTILIAKNTDKSYQLKFSLNTFEKKVQLELFEDLKPKTFFQSMFNLTENQDHRKFDLPRNLFISYNTKEIHKILTLNFFRFLDSMPLQKKTPIYEAIGSLNDTELHAFLVELGQKMSDKSEFNLYSAHQIDFESIREITSAYETKGWQFNDRSYTFELQNFVKHLQSSDSEILKTAENTFEDAKRHLPHIFNSYRFLDYLLTQIPKDSTQPIHTELQNKLKELRQKVTVPPPAWLQEIDRKKNNVKEKNDSSLKQEGPKKE